MVDRAGTACAVSRGGHSIPRRKPPDFEEGPHNDLSIPLLGQEKFRGVFIRSPVVKHVGPAVEVLSQLEKKTVAVKQGSVIGTSFHPELSGDTRLHEYFVQLASKNPLLC